MMVYIKTVSCTASLLPEYPLIAFLEASKLFGASLLACYSNLMWPHFRPDLM